MNNCAACGHAKELHDKACGYSESHGKARLACTCKKYITPKPKQCTCGVGGNDDCEGSKTKFCNCMCQVCDHSEFGCTYKKSDKLIEEAISDFIESLIKIDEKQQEGLGDTYPREIIIEYVSDRLNAEL